MSTFTYHGRELNRFDHLYNSTAISERGVEVAVTVDFLANRIPRGGTLEVGNVLQHYEDAIEFFPRDVVDLYEIAYGVENIDVFDIRGPFDTIVSISTLEHVGFDYDPPMPNASGPIMAITHLRSLLTENGVLLVTFGFGFNTDLDEHVDILNEQASRWTYLNRRRNSGWASEWYETQDVRNRNYGTVTPWANTVWIGEFGPIGDD